jgi:predicted HAD superfamily Cof-like phosphohydrolase
MNPFSDQRRFMEACGQTTGHASPEQAILYARLVAEEHEEWVGARRFSRFTVDDLDAVIDQIVVLIGYAISCGYDIEGAWQEVMRSNMAKIDPDTGRVRRREDGKILKPPQWLPPDLARFV